MILLSGLVLLEWLTLVKGEDVKIRLRFQDGIEREYSKSSEAISNSKFIKGCRNFNSNKGEGRVNDVILVEFSSSRAFESLVDLASKNYEKDLSYIVDEISMEEVLEITTMLEFLEYSDEITMRVMKRIIRFVLPKFMYSTEIEEKTFEIESGSSTFEIESGSSNNGDGYSLLLSAYLRIYELGMLIDNGVVVICNDPCNQYSKKNPYDSKSIITLRILPEAMNAKAREIKHPGGRGKPDLLIWLFKEMNIVTKLDVSGCTISEVCFDKNIASLEKLRSLKLENCTFRDVVDPEGLLKNVINEIAAMNGSLRRVLERTIDPKKLFKIALDENAQSHGSLNNILGKSAKPGSFFRSIGRLKQLEELDISGIVMTNEIASDIGSVWCLKKLSMKKCILKPNVNFEFIKKLEELIISGNDLSEKQLDCIFGHKSIKVLDMDECTIDPMYIFGGKIKSTSILKAFNGCQVCIKDNKIRITLSDTSAENKALNELQGFNGRLLFFDNYNWIMGVKSNLITEDFIFSENLVDLNGSKVLFEENAVIVIPPESSCVSSRLKSRNTVDSHNIIIFRKRNAMGNDSQACTLGEEMENMNFFDPSRENDFLRNISEFTGQKLYFMHEKKKVMIISHSGMKKLGLRLCNLESYMLENIGSRDTLEYLDLGDNMLLGNTGISYIFDNCRKLKNLNVRNCGIKGGREFTGDIKIERLDLGYNKDISRLCRFIFALNSLKALDLSECNLKARDLVGIDRIMGLKELHIGLNFSLCQYDYSSVFKLVNLELLNMPSCGIGETICIDGIEKLKELKILDISFNDLYYAYKTRIFELVKLEGLNIRSYQLEPINFTNITRFKKLKRLSVSSELMRVADIDALIKLKGLEELRIDIFDKGTVDYFCANIGELSDSLLVLNLTCYGTHKFNFDGLLKLKKMVKFEFCCRCDDGVSLTFIKDFKCLKVLSIYTPNRPVEKSNMDAITSISTLETLKLNCQRSDKEYKAVLSELVNLKELMFYVEGVVTGEISGLKVDVSSLPAGLRKFEITDADLFLSSNEGNKEYPMNTLENLEIFIVNICCSNLSDEAIEAVLGSPRLRRVELCYSGVYGVGLERVGSISTLRELNLDGVWDNAKIRGKLLLPRYLRKLSLWNWVVDKECNFEMRKLDYLETPPKFYMPIDPMSSEADSDA